MSSGNVVTVIPLTVAPLMAWERFGEKPGTLNVAYGLTPMRYQYNTADSEGARGITGAVSAAPIRKLAV